MKLWGLPAEMGIIRTLNHSRLAPLLPPLALCVIAWLVYGQVWSFDFIQMDDALHIVDNPHLKQWSSHQLRFLWTEPYQGLYVPLTYTVWAGLAELSRQLFRTGVLNPFLFHVANALLHVLNTLWVYAVIRKTHFRRVPAFMGAALFALHPAQAESVAWASGTKDVLSNFFCFAAVWFHLHWIEKRRYVWQIIATLCYAFALVSKPSAIILPAFLWIYGIAFFKQPWKSAIRFIPWLLIAIPFLWITKNSQPNILMRYVTPLWGRPFIVGDSLLFYISKILFPVMLGPDYARAPEVVLSRAWGYLGTPFLIVLSILLARRDPRMKWLGLLLFVGLLPVLGFIPFFYQFFSTVADRYLYFVLLLPALGVAWIWEERSPFTRFLMGSILVSLCLFTHKQVSVWQDDESLFRHLVFVNPSSRIGHNNLGTILEKKDRIDEAGYHYRETLRLDPGSLPAMYNLGRVCGRQKNYVESIYLLEELLKLNSQVSEAHYTLGIVYREIRNLERSLIHLSYATELEPGLARAHFQLGITLKLKGSFPAAHHSLLRALALDPKSPNIQCALADTLVDLRLPHQAEDVLNRIALKHPTHECLEKIRARTDFIRSPQHS